MHLLYNRISDLIDKINNTQVLPFRLENLNKYDLLPNSEKNNRIIKYGENSEIYLILYNWGTKELLRMFFLQNEFAKSGYFKEAYSILNEVIVMYNNQRNRIVKKSTKEEYKIYFQSMFMIFHEMGHCVLYSYDDIRESYYNAVNQEFKYLFGTDDLYKIYQQSLYNVPWYLRKLSKWLSLKGQIDDILNKKDHVIELFIEEYSCDFYSADMFFKLNSKEKCFCDKEMQLICSSILEAQNCVAEYVYMQKYIDNKEKIPKNMIPMFCIRRSILISRLYDILQNEYAKYIN